ncbi:TPA: hypothetical protein MHT89_04855 [Klebsiella pneumoniae]|nr:hypothetical protein [Klebsiella pneumoniae]OYG19087.1 hypothetical protein CI646_20700 [Klebsiella pneumoniae subsp. pneumoniae]PXK05946.1 hypothetical protein DMR34_15555 [Klebsiella variicola]MBK2604862.1 hypothetical protein [Klebsiella pneumoniae]MCQ4176448.1 hypothetical protein [Klebsiella pneumoniae]
MRGSDEFAGSCEDDGKSHHEENQQSPALDRNPDLAYERVVPQSHEVNQLSLSESDIQPSLRGEPLCNPLRVMQNSPEIIGCVNGITEGNPVHSANGISPVLGSLANGGRTVDKGRISDPTLWLVGESLHFLVPECWFGLLASLRQIATFSPCSNRVK